MRSLLVLLIFAPFTVAAQPSLNDKLDQLDGVGRSLVKAKCAHPLSKSEEKVQNRHVDGVIDFIRRIQCTDYSLQFYVANAYTPPHELPMRLNVHKQQKRLPSDLNIGASESQIRSRLGTPNRVQNGNLVYIVGEEEADTITFLTKDGYVVEIDWSWDVD